MRQVKEPEIRKAQLLDASEILFSERGYDRTSVSDIVRHVGVAQGTFYYHFKSKEELLEALADRFVIQILSLYDQVIQNSSNGTVKKVELFINGLLQLNDTNDYILQYVHRENNAVLHQKLAGKALAAFSLKIEQLFIYGNKDKEISTVEPRTTAEIFLMTVEYLQELDVFLKNEPQQLKEKKKAIAAVIERLLGIPGNTIEIK